MRHTATAIHVCLVLVLVTAAGCGRIDNARHVEPLRELVSAPPWADDSPFERRLWSIEQAFYEQREHAPAWIDGDRPTPQLEALIEQLRESVRHGLDPAAYHTDELERRIEQSRSRLRGTRVPAEEVPDLDARLTYAYLRHAADLLGWSTTPQEIDRNWVPAGREEDRDLAAHLQAAISSGEIEASLEELAPAHPQYTGLQAALAIVAQSDEEDADGRAEQIRMNLERWRWAPRDLGDRYVLVNVPAYQLAVMEGDRPVLAMRVIVGTRETPTPVFSDQIAYVVFSPYWNIPESILRQETLPRVIMDPDYLARSNIEVIHDGDLVDPATIDWSDEDALEGLRFRQAPGPENALGLVKFIFPNRFSVYLHDTPGTRLFARERRAFSHGCVRVEQPVELASYVLRDQPDWTEARIRSAMKTSQEQIVRLTEPLPVHIGYWTTWVDADTGTVTYLDDPYEFDRTHARVRDARDNARTAQQDAGVS